MNCDSCHCEITESASAFFQWCAPCMDKAYAYANHKAEPQGRTFEYVGPTIVRHDGTTYMEQQWK